MLLIALVSLSGCVDSLSAEQRLYCLDLTEEAYAFVPECKTQEECFSSLERQFFAFDHSVFGSETQTKLYSYKNNVSLSWLYFNKARESISEIRAICSKNSSISSLLFHLNELTHSMAKGFEFSDYASKESFSLLLLEFQALEEEGIYLIKEEPLLGDFASISDNLNQLSQETDCTGNPSYSCFYLDQTREFAALAGQTGFSDNIVSEANIFDLLISPSEAVANYLDSGLKIPIISPALPSFLLYLSNVFTGREAISGLEKTQAFRFTQLYSGFVGTDNSCLTMFAAIIKSDSLHRQALIERNNQLEQTAEQGLEETRQSIDALLSSNYASFDQNFFHQLYAGLGQESSLAAQKHSIRDFGEFRVEAEQQLFLLSQEFYQFRQKQALQQLSLGEKAASLKHLNSEISLLQENISFLSNEVINGLLVLCNERSLFMEQQLDEAELPKEYLLKAADLKARAKFKLKLFNQASLPEQKLFLCSEAVQEFEAFSLALEDFEVYSLREETSLDKCLSFIALALENQDSLNLDLGDFSLRFHQLQQIEKPYSDIDAVKRICISLEQDLRSFLQSQGVVQHLEENFSASTSLLSSLRLAEARGTISPSKARSFETQMDSFQKFFNQNLLSLENALPLLPDLDNSLSEFSSALTKQLNQAIISFAEQNAVVSIQPTKGTVAGLAFDETVSIEFDNPFLHSIEGQLTLAIPFGKTAGSLISSSDNVLSFSSDGKTLAIDLNSLPQGKTFLQFSTVTVVEKQEKLELLSATTQKATFSKKISLNCAREIPSLQIKTELLEAQQAKISSILVLQGEKTIPFTQNNSQLSFFLENCIGSQETEIIFSVEHPIGITLSLIEETFSQNEKIYTYSVGIENRLAFEFSKIEAILPTSLNPNTTLDIQLFGPTGKEIEFSTLSNGNISLILPSLLPMQKGITYTLKVFSEENAPPPQENPASQTLSQQQVNQIQSSSEKISSLNSTISEAEQTISLLESLFSQVSEEQIISAKYISPISEAELDKLKLSLNCLRSFQSKNSLQEFSSLSDQEKFDSPQLKSIKFPQELGEKLLEAQDIGSRLNNAFNAIKEDAVVSYNSAADLFNQNPDSQEAENSLEQARQQLLEGNFLESIASSKNATALISLSPQNQLNLPIFALPIAACAGLVLFIRLKRKKHAKQKKQLFKKIEKSWKGK